ncbi:MAG TPA: hypothetical protein VJA26_05400 [Gammaproteobacteria bacterium]|nr:hypothetical protein [Gammaproteobacteria bacterium]
MTDEAREVTNLAWLLLLVPIAAFLVGFIAGFANTQVRKRSADRRPSDDVQ